MGFFDRFAKPVLDRVPDAPASAPVHAAPVATAEPGAGRSYRLDTLGQVCPFPLVEAKQAIAGLAVGDRLIIDFDCTQATDSIPNWAASRGYPVTHFEQVGDATWTITVQKA